MAIVLSNLEDGRLMHDASEALKQVVQACVTNGGKGAMILKLKVESVGDSAVQITPELQQRLPMPIRQNGIFFAGEGGQLSRNSQSQPELPLREVNMSNETKEVKIIDGSFNR